MSKVIENVVRGYVHALVMLNQYTKFVDIQAKHYQDMEQTMPYFVQLDP